MSQIDTQKQNNGEQIPKTSLAFLRYVSRPHLKWAVGGFIFVTIAQMFASSLPYIYKMIVNTAQSVAVGKADIGTVWFWGVLYIVFVSLMLASWRASGFIGMRWAAGLNETAYNALFAYISEHSHTYFSNHFAGSLSSAIGHASDGAPSLVQAFLWEYYPTALSLLFTMGFMASVSLLAAGLFASLLIILIPLNIVLSKRRRPHVVAYSKNLTAVHGRAVDSISNIAAVRQFVRHGYELSSFADVVSRMRASNLHQWGMSEWILVLNNIIVTTFEAAIFFSVLHLWTRGAVSVGDVVLILTLLMNVMGSLVFIGNSMNGFIRRYGEIQEGLSEVLLPHEIVDIPNARKLEAYEGKIEFQGVSFAYGDRKDREVFSGLDLVIKPGQRVGIVGPSGAGKSTFVSLLLRQHELSGGQRQRIAIARAMLKDAPILVLDEATSSLDSESEVAVQKALHTLMEGKTVIAIAHRLSTLREMDRILVIDAGKVMEDGTHVALLKQGGLYASLWEHQAGGFLQEE